jgi:hypothetical protein
MTFVFFLRCMKNLLLLSLCLLLCIYTQAQYSDSVHYYLGYTASGNVNQTNDGRSYLLNNALKAGIRQKKISFNLSNSWIYGAQNSQLTNNDFQSALDVNFYTGIPHFYYWGLGNYTTSYSLKINHQVQGGAGAAYSVVDTKDNYLNLSDGILYEKSDLYLNDTTRDRYNTFRNSARLSFKFSLVKNIVIVNGTGFLQNSLSNSDDYIIRANAGLAVKLKKWLALTAGVTYNRFNRTRRENMLFTYGVTIERYF